MGLLVEDFEPDAWQKQVRKVLVVCITDSVLLVRASSVRVSSAFCLTVTSPRP